jgi:hypothetical protein
MVDEWNDEALRRLWREYKLADTTQKQLALKYGLPLHRIGFLLRQAREKFGISHQDCLAILLNWETKPSPSTMTDNSLRVISAG